MARITNKQLQDRADKLQDKKTSLVEYVLLIIDPIVTKLFNDETYGDQWNQIFDEGLDSRIKKIYHSELVNIAMGGQLNPLFNDPDVGGSWQNYFREAILEKAKLINFSSCVTSKQIEELLDLIVGFIRSHDQNALEIVKKVIEIFFDEETTEAIISGAEDIYRQSLPKGDTRDIKTNQA
jgi:hypothetical protein